MEFREALKRSKCVVQFIETAIILTMAAKNKKLMISLFNI